MKEKIKILSIDGGGTRGVFPATMLHCLEQANKQPVTSMFDVIVGASTGAIIAAALAAGMPTQDIVDIYLKKADYILPVDWSKRFWDPLDLFSPRYTYDHLKTLLKENFGEVRLADIRQKFGTHPIFLFASLDLSPDLEPGETPSLKVVVFNSAFSEFEEETLVDITMRASVAAVKMPMYQHFIEGGNYANNPAMIGYAFAVNKQPDTEGISYLSSRQRGLGATADQIRLLSLGCGTDGSSYIPRDEIGTGRWGLLKWQHHLINLIFDAKMAATGYYLRQLLDSHQYLRINPYYKSKEAPTILRDKKLRFDVRNKEQLEAIHHYARQIFAKEQQRIQDFLES